MRIIDLFENNRQHVFHSTSPKYALQILKQQQLQDKTSQVIDGQKGTGVSTSRSKKFSTDWNEVTFELDLNAIKHNNKVVPVDFVNDASHYNVERRSNSEEFIVGPLNNLSRSLVKVYFKSTIYQSDYYDDILDELYDKYNVEIEYL